LAKNDLAFILGLMVIVIVFPFVAPNSYYITVAIFVGINALTAIGMSLLLGYTGQISFGHNAFFGLGAYASALFCTRLHFPPLLATASGVVLSIVLAVLIGAPALMLKGHYLAMATLAFGVITYIVLNEWTSLTQGASGIVDIPNFSIWNLTLSNDTSFYFFVWLILIAFIVFFMNLVDSRFGRALRAIRSCERAAMSMGINVSMIKLYVFILSAITASLAGSFYAHYVTFISPNSFGPMYSILIILMVMIGGMRSILGGLFGAVVLTILTEFLRAFENIDTLIYGLIIVLVMFLAPEGIVPNIGRLIGTAFKEKRSNG
jgi:branched-chain amino acid transport system permease protein